jgi:hypothetical protein
VKNTYEIIVSDTHGWDEGCPDYESVFFSPELGQAYIHPMDEGHENAGSLIVIGYRAARLKLADLETTGDWRTHGGGFDRPEYAMRKAAKR